MEPHSTVIVAAVVLAGAFLLYIVVGTWEFLLRAKRRAAEHQARMDRDLATRRDEQHDV
jgi:hypothetical protein